MYFNIITIYLLYIAVYIYLVEKYLNRKIRKNIYKIQIKQIEQLLIGESG